jgi:hypothetical protein
MPFLIPFNRHTQENVPVSYYPVQHQYIHPTLLDWLE